MTTTQPLYTVTLPIRVKSEMNQREHWAVKAKRVKQQRGIVSLLLKPPTAVRDIAWDPTGELVVRLVRIIGKRGKAYDVGDNLNSSFKAVRDQVATAFGVDDREQRIRYEYDQERGKEHAVRIEIYPPAR